MKFKPKLFFKRALTFFTATTMSVGLGITALAAGGTVDGNIIAFTAQAQEGKYAYGYWDNNLSWKVDVYVSSRPDGTLNPSADSVKVDYFSSSNNSAKLVGSLLFTNKNFNASLTYIQSEYSTGMRDSYLNQQDMVSYIIGPNVYSTPIYDLPQVEPINGSTTKYGKELTPCYVIHGDLNGLPENIGSIGSDSYYIRNIVNKPEFTSNMINHLKKQMGDATLVTKLVTYVDGSILAPYSEEFKNSGLPSAYDPLFPDNPDCPVEWMVVVCPIMQWNANTGYTNTFWLLADEAYLSNPEDVLDEPAVPTIKSAGHEGQTITLMLDAFGSAQYNYVTRKISGQGIFELQGMHNALADADVSISTSKMSNWQDKGILRNEYGTRLFSNIANASLINEDVNPYFSIPKGVVSSDWSEADMARKGGIGIYVCRKKTDIPIYTHTYTYTPGNPNPTIFTSQTDTVPPTQAYISVDSAHR